MEVAMTDEATVRIFHEIVGVGTVNKKPRKTGIKCNGDGVVFLEMPLKLV
jgi:hypothetical protein